MNSTPHSSIAPVFSGLHSQRLELHNQDNFSIPPYCQMLATFHLGEKKKNQYFLSYTLGSLTLQLTRETKQGNVNRHFHWHGTEGFSHSVGHIQQNGQNKGDLE